MVNKWGSSGVKIKGLVLGLLLGAVLMLVLAPGTTAQAHCDSRKGPVATAAVKALETGDVTVISPYVAPESEAELEDAFAQALEVRALGGNAQALADEYLLEYTGEGKSYSYLVKMAERYGKDGSIVADRICPKYPLARQAEIRAGIEAGGYWVDWDLRGDNE